MRPLLRPPSLNDDDLDPWHRTLVQLSSSDCELSARLRRKSRRLSAPPSPPPPFHPHSLLFHRPWTLRAVPYSLTAAASAGLHRGRYDDADGGEEVGALYDGRYDDCDDASAAAVNRRSVEAAILGLRRVVGYGGGRGGARGGISGLGCYDDCGDRELVDEDELYEKVRPDISPPRAGEGANHSGRIGGVGELPRLVEASAVISGECPTVATKTRTPDDDQREENRDGDGCGEDKRENATNDASATGAPPAAPPTPPLSSSSITVLPPPNIPPLLRVSDAAAMAAASNANPFLRTDGGGSDLRRQPAVEGPHVDAAAAILGLGALSGAAVVDGRRESVVECLLRRWIDTDPGALPSRTHSGTQRRSLPSSMPPPPERTNHQPRLHDRPSCSRLAIENELLRAHDGVHRGRGQCLRLPPVPALPPLALPPHRRTSRLTPLSSQPPPMTKASPSNGALITSPPRALPGMDRRRVSWDSRPWGAPEAGKRYPASSPPTGAKPGNASTTFLLTPSTKGGATEEGCRQNGEEKERKTSNPIPPPLPEGGEGVSQRKRKRKLASPDGESKDSFGPPAGPRCRRDPLPGVDPLEDARDVREDATPTEEGAPGPAEEPRSKHKHDREKAPYHRPFTKTDEIKRGGWKKGKYIPRNLVVHVPYRDWSNEPPPSLGPGGGPGVARLAPSSNGTAGPKFFTFPARLFGVLEELEKDGIAGSVASWRPHGRCFAVHNPQEFERLWPVYVGKAGCSDGRTAGMKYQSFQRQLNLYGFLRITAGRDKGCSYHPMFLRGRGYLAQQVPRIRVKGNRCRAADNPDEEPNFYAMPPVRPLGTVPPRLPPLPKQWPENEDGVHHAPTDKIQTLQHYVHSKCSTGVTN